jgi:hypothetical protein
MKISKLAALMAALCLAFGLVVAGCGSSDSPEDVVESFYTALGDGDAGEICDLLSSSAQEEAAAGEDSCEDGVKKAIDSGAAEEALGAADEIEVGEVTEDGDTAKVAVSFGDEESEVPLVKEDDEWKIDIG